MSTNTDNGNKRTRKPLPGWVKVTLWGTLAIVLAAILVPAALQTFTEGLRGEFNPAVIEQREHNQAVELAKAKALATIDAQKKRIAALEKILSGTGTTTIPTGAILRELPACELEDGSTQSVCVWDGRKQGNKVGAIVVNIDKGKISFYPQTNGWVVNK